MDDEAFKIDIDQDAHTHENRENVHEIKVLDKLETDMTNDSSDKSSSVQDIDSKFDINNIENESVLVTFPKESGFPKFELPSCMPDLSQNDKPSRYIKPENGNQENLHTPDSTEECSSLNLESLFELNSDFKINSAENNNGTIINLVKGKDNWKCLDPDCRTFNSDTITSCEVCKLPKSFASTANRSLFKDKHGRNKNKKKRNINLNYTFPNMEEYKFMHFEGFTMYLRDKQSHADYLKLKPQLQNLCRSGELGTTDDVSRNQVYVARINDEFQRIRIKEEISRSSNETDEENQKVYKVCLVDAGQLSTISRGNILRLPYAFQTIAPLTKEFHFGKVFIKVDKSEELLQWLHERLENKTVTVKTSYQSHPRSNRTSSMQFVDVYEGSSCINHEICEHGFAQKCADAYKSSSCILLKSKAELEKQRDASPAVTSMNCSFATPPESDTSTGPNLFPSFYSECQTCPMNTRSSPLSPSSSLCSIPSATSVRVSNRIDHKDWEIYSLKGEVKAYKDALENHRLNNFSTKFHSTGKKIKKLMEARAVCFPFISEESALMRSINLLFGDCRFHSSIDTLIQEGIDLQKMLDTEKSISIDNIKHFEELLYSFKLDQKAFSLQILEKQLQIVLHKVSDSKLSFGDLDHGKLKSAPYTRIGKDLLSWKDEYENSQKVSDEAVERICSCLQQYSAFLKSIIDGEETEADFSLVDSQELWDPFDKEVDLVKKASLIPLACHSVLNEIKLRLVKVEVVELFLTEVKNIDPNFIYESISCESVEKRESEEIYPTLLSFISQSKIMSPQTKCIIIEDLVHGLSEVHAKGECYLLLTPKNVIISEGAVLCPADKASIYEPIPPFKFFAPECDPQSEATSSPPRPPVGPAADCYSLGQLMMWLALVELKEDFFERMIDLQKNNPILKALLSRNPNERPSLNEVQSNLGEILSTLFRINLEEGETSLAEPEVGISSSSCLAEGKEPRNEGVTLSHTLASSEEEEMVEERVLTGDERDRRQNCL